MIYQLPNGKIIQISIDQYLDLTDEDIQYLMSINFGDYATSPWIGSAIKKKQKPSKEAVEDKSIDYVEEDGDKSHGDNLASDEIPLDDIPDVPDETLD
jgi:hypothetical protein